MASFVLRQVAVASLSGCRRSLSLPCTLRSQCQELEVAGQPPVLQRTLANQFTRPCSPSGTPTNRTSVSRSWSSFEGSRSRHASAEHATALAHGSCWLVRTPYSKKSKSTCLNAGLLELLAGRPHALRDGNSAIRPAGRWQEFGDTLE